MIADAMKVRLRPGDRAILEARLRAGSTEQRHLLRIRIVSEAADGHATRGSPANWRRRRPRSACGVSATREGLDGLEDRLRSGTPPIYGEGTDQRIRKVLDQPPPKGFARWNRLLIARAWATSMCSNAIVLCVDEKPSIQALERAQGYLKLPNGRAMTGQSHDYKRTAWHDNPVCRL